MPYYLLEPTTSLISASDINGLRFYDSTTLEERYPLGVAVMGNGNGVAYQPTGS